MSLLPASPYLSRAAAYSRWLAGRLDARAGLAEWLAETLPQPVSRAEMADFLAAGIDGEEALKRRLRQLRERVFARVMTRDLNGLADLAEVTRTLTDLAEVAVATALEFHHRELAAIHGEPLDGEGLPQRLIVVGMGKLGGGELNASSDIDLIFVFPEDGETAGPRKLENFEFFTRLGKRLINALDDKTGDGYVFRVDMRLRPYGDSGPLVSSFAMLEEYFYTQAREWERYAWIKGRALTGMGRVEELESLRRPFVFRKYLDFGAFGSMRDLHAQIRREVARKDMADNIKLGPGGIREIEFVAQVFQLIRGGRMASLRMRPTRTLLHQLAAYGLIPEGQAVEMESTYVFLRNVEHRLQYLDDAQTQTLPHAVEDRRRLAEAMGYADWEGFEAHLNSLRKRVAGHFEQVFGAPQEDQSGHPLAGLWELPEAEAGALLAGAGYDDPAAVLNQLLALKRGSRYAGLPASNKAMIDGLLPPLVEVAAGFANSRETLGRILDLLDAIARRGPYLALLKEYPQTLRQVVRIASSSAWAAQYLTRQPHLLDELLDARQLMAPPRLAPGRPGTAPAPGRPRRRRGAPDGRTASLQAVRDLPPPGPGPGRPVDRGEAVRPPVRPGGPAGVGHPGPGLGQPARPASGIPRLRGGRLRQAGRQGAGLCLGPGYRLPLRRPPCGCPGDLRQAGQAPQYLDGHADLGRHPLRDRSAPAPRWRVRTPGQ
jgi:glutamate-ammonia-ligase adenylyltransferase